MLEFAYIIVCSERPGGGIGRRAGLRILWEQSRAGSNPAPGTNKIEKSSKVIFYGAVMVEKIAKFMLENDKVAVWLNVELIEVKKSYAKIAMVVREDMLNAAGICQGGAIFSLADFAFALASNSYGKVALATSANINFANPAFKGERLIAEAKELNRTRRTGLYQIEVRKEENNQLVALFTGQVFIKDKEILP